MPENTNISFFDEYKKLDKLCSEMYGKNSGGVTCYLNDMMAVPVAQRKWIPEWNQTYDRLRKLRHIRNQMAHGEGSFEDYPCSKEDVLWLWEFQSKIMHTSDPLAVYRRQTEGSTHVTRAKEEPMSSVYQRPTARSVTGNQRMKKSVVEVIDEEEDDDLFEEEHGILGKIIIFLLMVLIFVIAVTIFAQIYMDWF